MGSLQVPKIARGVAILRQDRVLGVGWVLETQASGHARHPSTARAHLPHGSRSKRGSSCINKTRQRSSSSLSRGRACDELLQWACGGGVANGEDLRPCASVGATV